MANGTGPAGAAIQAALLLLSLGTGCGREDGPAPTPEPGPTQDVSRRPQAVRPETEVSASSGSVKLVLRLHRTKVRAYDSLWYQIRLENVGQGEMIVTGRTFQDPWAILENFYSGAGIFIEVFGPDGKRLQEPLYRYPDPDVAALGGVTGLREIETSDEKALVDGWKKQGLSELDWRRRLMEYKEGKRREEDVRARRPVIRLKPGEGVETQPFLHYNERERRRKAPLPQPIGDFAELDFFELDKPGKYRVRAVHNLQPSAWLMKARGSLPVNQWEVLVQTPWAEVTVLP